MTWRAYGNEKEKDKRLLGRKPETPLFFAMMYGLLLCLILGVALQLTGLIEHFTSIQIPLVTSVLGVSGAAYLYQRVRYRSWVARNIAFERRYRGT